MCVCDFTCVYLCCLQRVSVIKHPCVPAYVRARVLPCVFLLPFEFVFQSVFEIVHGCFCLPVLVSVSVFVLCLCECV